MAGGFFSASSASKSSSDSSQQSAQAGDYSLVSTTKSGQKSTNIGAGATLFKIGKGAHVTFESTDQGAIAAAQASIDRLVRAQADTTAAALGSVGNIAETRLTDGGNVVAGSVEKIALGVAAVAALFALLWFFKKR